MPEKVPPGYLFAFLRSNVAFRLLRSISTGGKQQEQHAGMMWRFPIPRLSSEREHEISRTVEAATALFDKALGLEDEAWRLVCEAIEQGA
jgi:type I restriction enzyme S subunit